jgi:hypothetical protein
MHLRWIALPAAVLALLTLAACGGGGSDSKETFKRDTVADCLQRAGATGIIKTDAGKVPGGVAKQGAIQGTVGRTSFALAFEPDDATAASTAGNIYAQLAGGSEQGQVLADAQVKRSANVAIAYQRPPSVNDSQTIASCLGGKDAIKAVTSSG